MSGHECIRARPALETLFQPAKIDVAVAEPHGADALAERREALRGASAG